MNKERGPSKGVPGRNPLLRNKEQVRAALVVTPMYSRASELLGWVSYLTGPREKEAQRLGVESVAKVKGPPLTRLVYNGHGAELTQTSTDKCSLSSHHILLSTTSSLSHSPPHKHTHIALEPEAN